MKKKLRLLTGAVILLAPASEQTLGEVSVAEVPGRERRVGLLAVLRDRVAVLSSLAFLLKMFDILDTSIKM